jgi:hypothetical protein
MDLYLTHDMGEIGDKEYDLKTDALFLRLNAIREQEEQGKTT